MFGFLEVPVNHSQFTVQKMVVPSNMREKRKCTASGSRKQVLLTLSAPGVNQSVSHHGHPKTNQSSSSHGTPRVSCFGVYSWHSYDPIRNTEDVYLMCPIVSLKKRTHVTTFHSMKEVLKYLSSHGISNEEAKQALVRRRSTKVTPSDQLFNELGHEKKDKQQMMSDTMGRNADAYADAYADRDALVEPLNKTTRATTPSQPSPSPSPLSFSTTIPTTYRVVHEPVPDLVTVHEFQKRIETITGKHQDRVTVCLELTSDQELSNYAKSIVLAIGEVANSTSSVHSDACEQTLFTNLTRAGCHTR